jgi:hypothetical protein
MFTFFEDFFNFSNDDAPKETHGESSNPISDIAKSFFDTWQSANSEFFNLLDVTAQDDTSQNFVDAWHQATEDFADQYANWWGWTTSDDSPV